MGVRTHICSTLFATFLILASCTHNDGASSLEPVELRVNAGSTASYKDQRGHMWEPDREYDRRHNYGFTGGGDTADRGWNSRIQATDDPRIYQTERWGMEEFVARVPDGTYTVLLHFVETYEGIEGEGSRVFDVKIENHEVLKGFDIFSEAGGRGRAVVKEFRDIAVNDGWLQIRFVARRQNPLINGIEILSQ